jgi:ketosteroid isomerase-like protein
MKTKTLFFSMFLLVLFTVGSAQAQSENDFKAQIEKRNKQMTEYMLKGDTEKSMTLYTDDAISMPSYEPMHQGIAEIKKANKEMVSSGWKFDSFEPTIVKVIPMGDLITEIGTYKVSMTMGGTNEPMKDQGKYLTIWEKQKDGTLKIKVETWNSDMDPMNMLKSANKQAELDKR